ncbi:ligand-binding protein SH3 [Caballeronia ptereochthonis]|jgi:small multidrug resistance pump|uniref:Small multidrug resistance protein n=1 Tax=Caballeronia ptereochthonis TaxID=1777144 RepID=A0A158CE21_9BURK|nr:ligand-binding protein SH3 [Caballeronia ptereochthonis]SAK79767.1 small multidrug resistance protein [Caballeronia ptereochthonis]
MPFFFVFLSGTCSALASLLLRFAGRLPVAPNDLLIAGFAAKPLALRLAAIGAYGAGFAFYALALKQLELSIAYPMMVAITLVEILLFDAALGGGLSLRTATGAMLLLASVIVLYMPGAGMVRS